MIMLLPMLFFATTFPDMKKIEKITEFQCKSCVPLADDQYYSKQFFKEKSGVSVPKTPEKII